MGISYVPSLVGNLKDPEGSKPEIFNQYLTVFGLIVLSDENLML